MRSFLEIESMNARHVMETRSDYTRVNQYSETHPDALAPDYSGGQGKVHTTSDGQNYTLGKGTGHGGHSHWLPHCTSQINVFNFSNFDTAVTSNAGNELDNAARNQALTRSLYSALSPYNEGPNAIDTSMNVLEGQYVIY
jgi:hypothetical protein